MCNCNQQYYWYVLYNRGISQIETDRKIHHHINPFLRYLLLSPDWISFSSTEYWTCIRGESKFASRYSTRTRTVNLSAAYMSVTTPHEWQAAPGWNLCGPLSTRHYSKIKTAYVIEKLYYQLRIFVHVMLFVRGQYFTW